MTLRNLLTTGPRAQLDVRIELEFLEIGLCSATTHLDVELPIVISDLPDIIVGNTGNDVLNGNNGGPGAGRPLR